MIITLNICVKVICLKFIHYKNFLRLDFNYFKINDLVIRMVNFLEENMKDYMVEHTFKSEEIREQYFEIMKSMTADDIRKNMKNENANFQMNWNNEKNDMIMYCWWKANSPQAILDTLGDMAAMFDNNIKEMSNVMDVTG